MGRMRSIALIFVGFIVPCLPYGLLPMSAVTSAPPTAQQTRQRFNRQAGEAELEELVKGYDRGKIVAYGKRNTFAFAGRIAAWTAAYLSVSRVWEVEEAMLPEERTRGERLRREITNLGPVAVKVGQTLSQRPDILPKDVCDALKTLQTSNAPFADEDAWKVMAAESGWDGPIAPGMIPPGCTQPLAKPLFQSMSDGPIASASLGQVYRATTFDDREVRLHTSAPSMPSHALSRQAGPSMFPSPLLPATAVARRRDHRCMCS